MSVPKTNLLTSFDQHLFSEGKHFDLYKKLGANMVENGVSFAVWAKVTHPTL